MSKPHRAWRTVPPACKIFEQKSPGLEQTLPCPAERTFKLLYPRTVVVGSAPAAAGHLPVGEINHAQSAVDITGGQPVHLGIVRPVTEMFQIQHIEIKQHRRIVKPVEAEAPGCRAHPDINPVNNHLVQFIQLIASHHKGFAVGGNIVIQVEGAEDLGDDLLDDEDYLEEPNEWYFDDDPYDIVYYEFVNDED